jgi:YesN/AraC family two-component response regulator
VEDNVELMHYIQNSCQEQFNFFGASNGKEGYELAVDILPDLIISDVMMPEMDGFEFCRRVKNNILTSHIPVILLTAKSSAESQIEGFEAGADAYIPKPFRIDQLIASANSIIENRIRLREKFNSGKIVSHQNIKNTADDKFLQKVIDLINTNMVEQDFGVSELGKEIGISRVHLHRKLKAIANLSPNEFIRNIRLQKAGELLLNQDYNVSEVCFKVGFNSPAYFSSCFKQYYQLSPTEFIERSNNV